MGKRGPWEKQYQCQIADLQEIAHSVIDLLIQVAQNPLASASPTTPSSPHPSRIQHHITPVVHLPPPPYKTDQLMKLKILMRESEYPSRKRYSAAVGDLHAESEAAMVGRNEGTVRFLFTPSAASNHNGYHYA